MAGLSSTAEQQTIDAAITHITQATSCQYVDFLSKPICSNLERVGFARFIIASAPWIFGTWQPGDDVVLYFLTQDSENRWAEVVTEALEIEVTSADLKDASKDGTLDLTDERLSRHRDGRRTTFFNLHVAQSTNTRIELRYCKIAPEWIQWVPLIDIMKDTDNGVFSDWPHKVPAKVYTKHYREIRVLKYMCLRRTEDELEAIRRLYLHMQAWAEIEHLWIPGVLDPSTLLAAISSPKTLLPKPLEEYESTQSMLVDTLRSFVETRTCNGAMVDAAEHSLANLELTLMSVRNRLRSLSLNTGDGVPAVLAPSAPASSTPASKFRDARSALNRLRYDDAHADISYDVGYVDRFEGMKWMALANWGDRGTEEEDWIPEHRIRRIKRVDGVVVWDRELRIDRTGDV